MSVVAFAVCAFGQEADRTRTEARARRATERLQELQQEADHLASEEGTLLGDLRRLDVQRQITAEQLRESVAAAAAVAYELAITDTRVRQLQEQEMASRPNLKARLIEIYKLGQGRYLRLLLSASHVRQIGQASRMVATLARIDRDRVASHRHTITELKVTRAALEGRSQRLQALRAQAQRAQTAAAQAAQVRNDLIRDIDRRRDLNAQLLGELQTAQQHLQLAVRDLASGGAEAAAETTLPLRPFRGGLDWPTAGTVSRRFGRTGSSASPPSNGIEIAVDEGTPTLAIHDGVVAFADTFAGFGRLVILDHGSGTFSLYGNLLELVVKKGDRVEDRQQVGTVGASAKGSAGLYFELRVDGQPVDPLQWLKRR